MSLFLPTARQITVLLAVGALSLGCALYLRYLVIEQSSVGIACDAGLETWLCRVRTNVTGLFRHSVFGIMGLAAAAINLLRPSVVPFGLGLAAGGFGIVLYNVGLSALAIALLMLSLARPAPGTDSARGP
jgi:hypothetical protein